VQHTEHPDDSRESGGGDTLTSPYLFIVAVALIAFMVLL
jgi:hypothetical protein